MRNFAGIVALMLMLMFALPAVSEILTEDNCPNVNSESNGCNGGQALCHNKRFYVSGGRNSYLHEVDPNFKYADPFMDMMPTDARYIPWNNWVYFIGRKKPGIFRFELENGQIKTEPRRIVNAKILNYAVNDYGVFYTIRDTNGVFRVNHDGSERIKLSDHKIRSKNNVMRMMTFGDNLYYVESKRHHLYVVPCDGSGEARQIGNVCMHYFTMALWKGEPIVIYTKFEDTSDKLDRSYLGVIDMEGNRVEELSYLENICSRYINYMSGYLYFSDSNEYKYLKRIALSETAPEVETLLEHRVGYIQAFDNWITAIDLDGGMKQYFIDLKTLNSYMVEFAE